MPPSVPFLRHEHDFAHLWVAEHASIDEVSHTTFVLLACQGCRRVRAFPMQNYRLTNAQYKSDLNAALEAKGWHAIADSEEG